MTPFLGWRRVFLNALLSLSFKSLFFLISITNQQSRLKFLSNRFIFTHVLIVLFYATLKSLRETPKINITIRYNVWKNIVPGVLEHIPSAFQYQHTELFWIRLNSLFLPAPLYPCSFFLENIKCVCEAVCPWMSMYVSRTKSWQDTLSPYSNVDSWNTCL